MMSRRLEQLHECNFSLSKIRRITTLFAVLGLEIDSEMERKVGKYRDLGDGNSASSHSRRRRLNASEALNGHAGHHNGRDLHSRHAFRSKATKLLVKLREEKWLSIIFILAQRYSGQR